MTLEADKGHAQYNKNGVRPNVGSTRECAKRKMVLFAKVADGVVTSAP